MKVNKFNEKLNKINGNAYVVEEVIDVINGVYEAELTHDNVNHTTLNVYTSSKLTGDKVNTYTTSTPSLTPWKTVIKIYSKVSPLYVSYETSGDTVEADDINKLQDAILDTQNALNDEINRAENAENKLIINLNNEITRAKDVESTMTNNLNAEISRAKEAENKLVSDLSAEVNRGTSAESTITSNLNNEINRAKSAESTLTNNLANEAIRATNAESTLTNNLNSEIARAKAVENTIISTIDTNKPIWEDKYTKNEVDNKISQVINNMDWKESVATFNDLTVTYPKPDDGWTVNVKDTDITYRYNGSTWIPISANSIPLATSSVDGKMSKQDKIDHDDMVSKRHTHSNKSIIDSITQALIDNWNAAFTHISDAVKHITSAERTLWNTVSNKLDSTANAVSASKWATARTISLTGDVSGAVSVDGAANANITTVVADDSHNHTSSTITDFLTAVRATVLTGLSTATNSVISATDTVLGALGKLQAQITSNLTTLNNHTGNTSNPHSTTAAQVGLGNVTNDAQVKRSEMGVANGVATLDSSGINNQTPKAHTHDDRYYTETEADGKFATKTEISNAGYGDMLKSVYDTNGDGIVDNADKLDGYHAGNTNGAIPISNGTANINLNADMVDGKHATDFAPSGYGLGTLAKDVTSTDLNVLQTTGFYRGCTMTNAPTNGWYYIIVLAHGSGWAVQYATGYGPGSTNSAPDYMYKRQMIAGTWSSWYVIYNGNNKPTASDVGLGNVTNESKSTMFNNPTFTGTVTAPTFSGALSGNSSSATKLATARKINGVSFDATADITITDNTKVPKGCTWNDIEGV